MIGADNLANAFAVWVDGVLGSHPTVTVVAYNFNLYEHVDAFAVQLVGTSRFDASDPSWACDEAFSSGEELFEIPRDLVGTDWQSGLLAAQELIRGYLRQGTHAQLLLASRGIGLGFVDGDLRLVHARPDA